MATPIAIPTMVGEKDIQILVNNIDVWPRKSVENKRVDCDQDKGERGVSGDTTYVVTEKSEKVQIRLPVDSVELTDSRSPSTFAVALPFEACFGTRERD
jgi:hypothetical protein